MKSILWCLLIGGLLTGCSQGEPRDTKPTKLPTLQPGEAVATFAGGCFWAMEAGFEQLKGVREVVSGYSGSTFPDPTYEEVSTDETDHAESVQVYYDPKVITYQELLNAFFAGHDPTTLNKQGPDVGKHYRSVAFYRTPAEKQQIEATIQKVNASHHYPNPVVTDVVSFTKFYPAEGYHQNYCQAHPFQPYIQRVSMPKVHKMAEAMKGKLKPDR